ncbi:glutathione S-transferase 1-like [Silene latifolia]|uniref:glutathione S-transferase 1-like n=1 Tax=Silene latifolia TaxID=37657 RepID=UPI003D7721BF
MQPLHMRGVQMSIEKKVGEEEALLWVQQIINKGFYALETLLKDLAGKYSIGDEASMADVFLAPQVSIAMSRFHIDMVIIFSSLYLVVYAMIMFGKRHALSTWAHVFQLIYVITIHLLVSLDNCSSS